MVPCGTVPSSRKLLRTIEPPEVSEEGLPFSRPTATQYVTFPVANIEEPSLLPVKKKVPCVLI